MLDLNALFSTLVNAVPFMLLLYFGVTNIVDRWFTHQERQLKEITRQIALKQGINVFEYELDEEDDEDEDEDTSSFEEGENQQQVQGYQAQQKG